MIYLDNASTSWPKPPQVWKSVEKMLSDGVSSPGRGGHALARNGEKLIMDARTAVAKLLGTSAPEQIIFTPNATTALNLAIKGMLRQGDHVIASSMEHNSVVRPLKSMEKLGVKVEYLACDGRGVLDPGLVRKSIRPETRMIALSHASNVTGAIQPVKEIVAIARGRDVLVLLDAAQTAGSIPLNLKELPVDMLVFSGHKGLLGPPGTGGIYLGPGMLPEPLIEGGTGGNSEEDVQPGVLPDRYESGTQNTLGLAGLAASVNYLLNAGVDNIQACEKDLICRMIEGLSQLPGVVVYGPERHEERVGLVSFNAIKKDPQTIAFALDRIYGIATRPGLHCAPMAHRTIGTFPLGTVRASVSCFNTTGDVDAFLDALGVIVTEFR
ncbi:MAG: aminotransferase class V-fold PLP-dependent enzyme [Bacillota bacterium]